MIVPITPFEQHHLLGFLNDARSVPMPKKYQALVARLRDDVRSGQVNSQRMLHAKPFLSTLHTYSMNSVAQNLRWSRIPRWQRFFLLPAIVTFVCVVFPRRVKFYTRLGLVARAVNAVVAKCTPGGAPAAAPSADVPTGKPS